MALHVKSPFISNTAVEYILRIEKYKRIIRKTNACLDVSIYQTQFS